MRRILFFSLAELPQELQLGGDFFLRRLSISPERTALARFHAAVRAHLVEPAELRALFQKRQVLFDGIQTAERDEPRLFPLQCDTFKDAIFRVVVVSVADAERNSDVARLHGVRRRLALWNWYRITRRTFDTRADASGILPKVCGGRCALHELYAVRLPSIERILHQSQTPRAHGTATKMATIAAFIAL